ncbi:MAG: cellulase family glycosylhydrolase [Bacteroidota bacterium]
MPARFRVCAHVVRLCAVLLLLMPAVQAQDTGFFRTDGPEIVGPDGTPVVLRGIGLGGWLMPEGYMLHIAAPDGGSPRTIRAQIEDLIGEADTDRFFEIYRANYVNEKDIAAIAEWGFDHIRLPFHYRLFFDPETETFDEDGFALLDTFLEWCRLHELYVILDMHAAPGAQSEHNIADSDGVARLWTEPVPYQDQTVAIWAEIARRYAGEPLIIGYDLINEPVTPEGITGFDLRALYERITEAVRAVDTNHILFIEGNYFATHFPELIPPFDDNMVYAFHKYWNGPTLDSIQYLLDIRAQTNVPLWLGESGENSNPWFHAVAQLIETHRIGWNWWTHKKIETVTSPLSAPFAPGYEAVLNYWRGSGSRPSARAARTALFAMAEGLAIEDAELRPGVLASLFDPDFASSRTPFKEHVLPGDVYAVDYDLGNEGTTYGDTDVMATTGTPGGGNNGHSYRNDGVDIEPSTDPEGFAYNVGWTEALEWLSYTVNVETAGRYDVELRVASAVGGGQFSLWLGETQLGGDLRVANTGGWQNWTSVWLRDVALPAGEHVLKLSVRRGGFNVNRMRFTLVTATNRRLAPVPNQSRLLGLYPNPAADVIRVAFRVDTPAQAGVEVFDTLGRSVMRQPAQTVGAGEHVVPLRLGVPAGVYVLRLTLKDGENAAGGRVFTESVVITR